MSLGVQVQCPQLFQPAGNDGETVKAGGLGAQVLGDRLQVSWACLLLVVYLYLHVKQAKTCLTYSKLISLQIIEFPAMTHGFLSR